MTQTVIVLDFGSQYTQVIARRIREANVYSKVLPFNTSINVIKKLNPVGIVLSGGPASVLIKGAPKPRHEIFSLGIPVLGICYGLQLMGSMLGGQVKSSNCREYGRGKLNIIRKGSLFKGLPSKLTVWNSHGDCLVKLPKGFKALAQTENSDFASIEITMVELPNLFDNSSISLGFSIAAVFKATLSAPLLKILCASSIVLTPPPTVIGIKIFFDVSSII